MQTIRYLEHFAGVKIFYEVHTIICIIVLSGAAHHFFGDAQSREFRRPDINFTDV